MTLTLLVTVLFGAWLAAWRRRYRWSMALLATGPMRPGTTHAVEKMAKTRERSAGG